MAVLVHDEHLHLREGHAHRDDLTVSETPVDAPHCHREHLGAAVEIPHTCIGRCLHPTLQRLPVGSFTREDDVFQFRQASGLQHADLRRLDVAGGRHGQLGDMVLPQLLHQHLREGQASGRQDINRRAQHQGRIDIDDGVGVEEGRLVAEDRLLGEAVLLHRGLGIGDIAVLTLGNALGDAG